jgi:predicted RNase H-like HicB family nuclease
MQTTAVLENGKPCWNWTEQKETTMTNELREKLWRAIREWRIAAHTLYYHLSADEAGKRVDDVIKEMLDDVWLSFQVEVEADGRVIASVPELPGVMAYGATEEDAVAAAKALAVRVLSEQLLEQDDSWRKRAERAEAELEACRMAYASLKQDFDDYVAVNAENSCRLANERDAMRAEVERLTRKLESVTAEYASADMCTRESVVDGLRRARDAWRQRAIGAEKECSAYEQLVSKYEDELKKVRHALQCIALTVKGVDNDE